MEKIDFAENAFSRGIFHPIFLRSWKKFRASEFTQNVEDDIALSIQDIYKSETGINKNSEENCLPPSPKILSGSEFGCCRFGDSDGHNYMENDPIIKTGTVINGEDFGDIPTVYTIDGILPHELLVKGTIVHPKITPGFCYIVRQLNGSEALFKGKPLCLQKVGNGIGKRITFAGKSYCENDNYFWSDSHPAGYGFTLELIHIGDEFNVLDNDQVLVGSLKVTSLLQPQYETEESIDMGEKMKKQAYISVQCNIDYEEKIFSTESLCVSGVAIAVRETSSGSKASVTKVRDCIINGNIYTLVPKTTTNRRRSLSIHEETNNDMTTSYDVEGLHSNELPVIGTYVDTRIIPGFKYKVRCLDSDVYMFNGVPMPLLSIGRGYGKRITFSDESLTENDNYFWSDSNPYGYGFTLEVVCEGDEFKICDSSEFCIGMATVYKIIGPQTETESHFVSSENLYRKKLRIQINCHITFTNEDPDGFTTRIRGTAVVDRRRGALCHVQLIDNLTLPHLFNSKLSYLENCVLRSP